MSSEELSRRILGSFELSGRKYIKVYFVLPRDLIDYLLDLVDIFGGVDNAIEKAIMMTHESVTSLTPQERLHLIAEKPVDKDISELKEMVKRLEKRIKEVVAEIISRSSGGVLAEPVQRRRESRVGDVELPDLVQAESVTSDSSSDEAALSLEEAITRAIVVAIDEELGGVLGEEEKKD